MLDVSALPDPAKRSGPDALALAAQAKVLSGAKLEQLVVRIQRHTGRPKEACWRFVIQHGIKGKVDYRRWTQEEIDFVREELVRRSVAEVAKQLGRTARSVRNMLCRNQLPVREIRCDLFSLASLSRAIHVRKSEILFWIEQGWLQATCSQTGKRASYSFSPEALMHLYKHHLHDLLRRGISNYSLFEAYVQYVYSPKHTVGEQLLQVRRDKRERAAVATAGNCVKEGDDTAIDVDDDEPPADYQLRLPSGSDPDPTGITQEGANG